MEEDSSIDYSNGFLDVASEEVIQNNSNSSDHRHKQYLSQ